MTDAGVPAAGIARVSGMGLAYEAFGNRSHEAVLLIVGAQMVTWPLAFCVAPAERGFWVVRDDSRDVGRSDTSRQLGTRRATLQPVVVVHGDADPLIRLSAAVALAEAIPGAELRVVEGMGHALPRLLLGYLAELVAANARRRPAAPMGEGG